jgi:glutamate-1-semialdehyde 2,1-aminomutase
MTLFFAQTQPRNFAEARACDRRAFGEFFRSMLAAGIVLPPSQFEAWFISAAHDDVAIEATGDAVRQTGASATSRTPSDVAGSF